MTELRKYADDRAGTTLAMVVADQLREMILHDYPDGALIGSEDDLVEHFGVSRPTLRQAVRMVQSDGLVTVRRGNSGGFFASSPSVRTVARTASLLLRHQGATTEHVDDASRLTAPEIAALAAANPDAGARAGLLDFVRDAWSSGVDDLTEATHVAAEFGRRSGELSRNPALALFAATLSELAWAQADAVTADVDRVAVEKFLEELRGTQQAIAEAVADGDADRARAAAVALADLRSRLIERIQAAHGSARGAPPTRRGA